MREKLSHLRCRFQTIHARHGKVQGNDVGLDLTRQFNAFPAIVGFRASLETVGEESRRELFSYRGIVVHDQDGLTSPAFCSVNVDFHDGSVPRVLVHSRRWRE